MPLSLYEGRRYRDSRFLVSLIVVDVMFAATSVFWWTVMSLFVAEPIKWATWRGVGTTPELFEYPFVLLWVVPMGGICAGWLAEKAEQPKLAFFCVLSPLIFLGLIFGWYYLTPPTWH